MTQTQILKKFEELTINPPDNLTQWVKWWNEDITNSLISEILKELLKVDSKLYSEFKKFDKNSQKTLKRKFKELIKENHIFLVGDMNSSC